MATKYRFKPANATNPNAIIESWDIDELKAVRSATAGGGNITAVEVTFFVANDPEASLFDSYDAAAAKKSSLAEGSFWVDEFVQPIDPQPEGLND